MVNTFVLGSISYTVSVLDNKRLGKQRLEAKQIINALEGNGGWENHPATKMWEGYIEALKYYFNKVLKEWIKRGFNNSMEFYEIPKKKYIKFPWWIKFDKLHLTHKASLLRKDYDYYSEKFEIDDELREFMTVGYFWPHKYSKHIEFNIFMCEPIGCGAPAQYRWTKKEIKKWIKNKDFNPKTGRRISSTSKTGIYADLKKAAKYYDLI